MKFVLIALAILLVAGVAWFVMTRGGGQRRL